MPDGRRPLGGRAASQGSEWWAAEGFHGRNLGLHGSGTAAASAVERCLRHVLARHYLERALHGLRAVFRRTDNERAGELAADMLY